MPPRQRPRRSFLLTGGEYSMTWHWHFLASCNNFLLGAAHGRFFAGQKKRPWAAGCPWALFDRSITRRCAHGHFSLFCFAGRFAPMGTRPPMGAFFAVDNSAPMYNVRYHLPTRGSYVGRYVLQYVLQYPYIMLPPGTYLPRYLHCHCKLCPVRCGVRNNPSHPWLLFDRFLLQRRLQIIPFVAGNFLFNDD